MFNIIIKIFRSKTYEMDILIKELDKCNLNLDYLINNSNRVNELSCFTFIDIPKKKVDTLEFKSCISNYEYSGIEDRIFGDSTIKIFTESYRNINRKYNSDNFLKCKRELVSAYKSLNVTSILQFEHDYKETIIRLLRLIKNINYEEFKGEVRNVATEILELINNEFYNTKNNNTEDIMDDLRFELEYLRKINNK